MTLEHILIFSGIAFIYSLLIPARQRGWALMVFSIFAVYWLQPALPVRHIDFILPTLTILLTLAIWATTHKEKIKTEDWIALGITLALVIVLALTRYINPDWRPTPSRPPSIARVLLGLALAMGIWTLLNSFGRRWKYIIITTTVVILGMFIVLKTETFTIEFAKWVREQYGYSVDLASVQDLQWLGFSYVAFRFIHLLRDRQSGKLPDLTLREHLTFVIFFPAFTAGPIDRAERFVKDFRDLPTMQGMAAPRFIEGITRISIGVFKKFIVADSIAIASLNVTNAEQATSTFHLWILLYLYALRLFFDFSGYSDIAIGIGYLFGIRLPENFDRPYLKSNITTFWQSWHMTLSNWVRFYVFMPISRNMMKLKRRPPTLAIILLAQLSTMIIIGLWHGITVNFFIWGLWHGVGLFIHKVWSDNTRTYHRNLKERPRLQHFWNGVGIVITFHFVTLGWVWFSLPDFDTASQVFVRLFGVW